MSKELVHEAALQGPVVDAKKDAPSRWSHHQYRRVIVCGGRSYSDREAVFLALDKLCDQTPRGALLIIQGGATGADALAREWCNARLVDYRHYPADWKAHGKAAGPLRNQRMIDDGRPDTVLAFPGGRGTADMVRRAKSAGLPVIDGASTRHNGTAQPSGMNHNPVSAPPPTPGPSPSLTGGGE